MPDDIDIFLDGADVRGTEHRAEARKCLEMMLAKARLEGRLEGAEEMTKRAFAAIDRAVSR